MKKIIASLFAVFLMLSLGTAALAVVEQSPEYYVADYAGVLSAKTKKLIIDYNAALEKQCAGAQLVVVTVKSLEGLNSREYAMTLMNNWRVGLESANGTLLLLSPEEKKGWLDVGAGIVNALDSNTASDMMEADFWPLVDAGSSDEAVTALMYDILNWYDGYYGSQVVASNPDYIPPDGSGSQRPGDYPKPGGEYPDNGYPYYTSNTGGSLIGVITVVIFLIVFVIIILCSIYARHGYNRFYGNGYGRYYGPGYGGFFGGPGFFFFGNRYGRRPPPPPFPHDNHNNNGRGGFFGGGGAGHGGGGFSGGGGAGHGGGFGGGGFGGGGAGHGGGFGGGGFGGGGAGHGGGGFSGGGGAGR